ncbi:MAG: radical SAM protein [Armatimonadota bacterium]|nr:radical SAM protein [Armatimonadota bacterium]
MRTLLVFPRFKYPSGDPPLGVAYLAAVLRERGLEVDLFDATFTRNPLRRVRELARRRRYELVGISALTSMIEDAAEIARAVKDVRPETMVIAGGPHPTVAPEHTLGLGAFDAVMLGEAEETLPRLIESGLRLEDQPGVWYIEGGEMVRNPRAEPIADLDALPMPAWDLLNMRAYLSLWYQLDAVRYGVRGTSIMASRGCPYRCSYCQPTLNTIFGRRVRRRSPGSLVAEARELRDRFDLEGLMWLDDTFLLSRQWMGELCEAFIEADLGLIWGCNVRADHCDRESLELMQAAGLRMVHIGIESASQRILDDVYHKGITIEQVRETTHLASGLGLKVRGYFMLGAPTESEEEVRASIRLANELPLDDVTFSITTPLPHTDLYEMTKDLIAADFSHFDYYKSPVYDNDEVLDPRTLDRLKKLAYVKFYLGPKRLWRTIRSVLGISGIRKALLKIKRF